MTIASHLQELRKKHETLSEMVELAQRIPAGELAKLASDRGIVIDGTAQVINGRAGQPVAEDGSEASEGEGLNDTQASQS